MASGTSGPVIRGGAIPNYYPYHYNHHGGSHPGVKIHNEVDIGGHPHHHNPYGQYGHSHQPYYPLARPRNFGEGTTPTLGQGFGIDGGGAFGPQHGLFGNVGKWLGKHKGDILNVATTVAGQVLGAQHGLSVDPSMHKKDGKLTTLNKQLQDIDTQERKKEERLAEIQKRKHLLVAAIQTHVLHSHLAKLTDKGAGDDGGADEEPDDE